MYPVMRHLTIARARYGPSADHPPGAELTPITSEEDVLQGVVRKNFSFGEYRLYFSQTVTEDVQLIRQTVSNYLLKVMLRSNSQDFMLGWIRSSKRILSFERHLSVPSTDVRNLGSLDGIDLFGRGVRADWGEGFSCPSPAPPFTALGFRLRDDVPQIFVASDAGFRELTINCVLLMFDLLRVPFMGDRASLAEISDHSVSGDKNTCLTDLFGPDLPVHPQTVEIAFSGETVIGYAR
jgi:hypothetical protein